MSISPLQFARDFQKLIAGIAGYSALDSKLIYLVAFWPRLKGFINNPAYQTYFDEYIPLVIKFVSDADLSDLSIDELSIIKKTLKELPIDNSVRECMNKVILALAKNFFYVGEIKQATEQLAEIIDQAEIEKVKVDNIDGQNELESIRQLIEQARIHSPALYQLLLPILVEWEKVIESVDNEGVCCLYVEKDSVGNSIRGRMKTLTGKVELAGKASTTDDIAFDNKVVAPDDPFIGVSYTALKAVRNLFRKLNSGLNEKAKRSYHAHFEIKNSGQTFTGDSIGLAVALLSYTNLLKTEISRQDRFLAADVAVTGSIDEDGNILPVDAETLCVKIKRAFFSPVKYMVVPEGNAETAKKCLDELSKEYLHRRLLLIAGAKLNDILEDHNVIRSERVCLGNYVTRKVVHYSRATKIQVPLLIGLLWVLLAILFPKYFDPWFDWHIDYIEVVGKRFKTVNADGQEIWLSKAFNKKLFSGTDSALVSNLLYWTTDDDHDGKDELFIAPAIGGCSHYLQFYNDGKLNWQKMIFQKTNYPGDIDYHDILASMNYCMYQLFPVIGFHNQSFVMTFAEWSPPVRDQLLLFDNKGNIVSGPYLHTGRFWPGAKEEIDLDNDSKPEFLLGGTNNRLNRAILLIINPQNLNGVSPPYNNDYFLYSGMPKGSQLYYITFPETELSDEPDVRNFVCEIKWDRVSKTCHISVVEGCGIYIDGRELQKSFPLLPVICYRLDANFIPQELYFPDGHIDRLNYFLKKTSHKPVKDPIALLDFLKANTIVYKGDSIIYYPAKGINYYK